MTSGSTAGRAGEVVVRYRDHAWRLPRGGALTLGRSSTCDVVLPDDPYVSRHAARLQVDDGFVLVHNDSRTKPLVLRPPVGEDRVVDPGAATTSRPYGGFDLVIAGRGGIPILVAVDLRALLREDSGGGPAADPAGDTRSPATVTTPARFTTGQRRVLAALCEPLLTRSGQQAVPATYAEIGSRLDLRPAYVRNVVKSVRETLTGHGVPGLGGDDPGSGDDYRLPLARWAVHHGWVTRADVDALGPAPEPGGDGRGTVG